MEAKNSGSRSKKAAYTTQYLRVIARELICIKDHFKDGNRGPFDRKQLGGLALSGGGVRSASFAFGVMQALAAAKADAVEGQPSILQRLHYLSTVSGGGFAGAALTRLMRYEGKSYDLSENFPLRRSDGSQELSPIAAIRYRASYLDANSGPAKLNVIGVVARTVFLTFAIYLLGLAAIVGVLHPLFLEPRFALHDYFGIESSVAANPMLLIAGGFGLLLVILWLSYSLLSGVRGGKYLSIGSRKEFEEAGGWIAFLALIAVTFGVLGQMPRLETLASTIEQKTLLGVLVGLGSIGAFYSQFRSLFGGISDKRWSSTILIWSSGIIVIGFMLVAARELALLWTNTETQKFLLNRPYYWIWIVCLAALFGFLGSVANVNYVGLHRFYRDRLMRTFLTKGDEDSHADEIDKVDLDAFCKNAKGLYHLINANVVLVNSDDPKFRGRGGDSYILSPLYTGSTATGWVCTNATEQQAQAEKTNAAAASNPADPGDAPARVRSLGTRIREAGSQMLAPRNTLGTISLASAMAVSGAALNPSAGSDGNGPTRSGMLPLMLSLLGIRLGYWQPNPRKIGGESRFGAPDFLSPGLLYGILQTGHREDSKWIELTDGGHFENMGLYELFRREVKLIIAADGSTDPEFSMSSFASAYERARNDFGVEVDISNYPANFNDMMPDSARPNSHIKRRYKLAEHGFAIGVITYKGDAEPGYIFYVNTVLTENLRSNLYSYKAEHPEFPDEPLTDQFFNEKQFDAYCQLGCELTEQMLQYARGWRELSGALGIAHRDNAKAWEKIADAEHISAEELFARKLTQISATLGDLTKQTTVERIARVFNKPQRKG